MDETGYCGENKEAVYIGTGSSITITLDVDGEENSVVITSNVQNPIIRGGFQFELISSTPVSDQRHSLIIFQINITYIMTLAISGQILRFNTTRENQVSGQTIVQSCRLCACIGYSITLCICATAHNIGRSCLLPIDVYQKKLDLSVSWEHPACCGWDGELEYTVMLECMDCGTALNKSTRLMSVSFSSLPTGMYRASVMAKNSCGENISNYTTVNHSAGESKILCTCMYMFTGTHKEISQYIPHTLSHRRVQSCHSNSRQHRVHTFRGGHG